MGKKIELLLRREKSYRPAHDGSLTVSGDLIIKVNKDINLKSIKLTMKGTTACEITTTVIKGKARKTAFIKSVDVFLKAEQNLLKEKTHTKHLHAGRHILPFKFYFFNSREIPSSFHEYKEGTISYKLKAKLYLQGTFSAVSLLEYIKVINPGPIGRGEYLLSLQQASFEREQSIPRSLWCYDAVIIRGFLNKRVLRMNGADQISIMLHIDNHTDRFIYPHVYIDQLTLIQVGSEQVRKCKTVHQLIAHPVQPHTRKNFLHLPVGPIAQTLPGTLTCGESISISYELKILLKGCGFLEKVPVIIDVH
ncbi:uncharacterized protein [Watersipora subatra]|uniref:uncharacterized protein n=1 Tax=Watersipora subatra TaxID=2589382 RepID=UPI00355BE46F